MWVIRVGADDSVVPGVLVGLFITSLDAERWASGAGEVFLIEAEREIIDNSTPDEKGFTPAVESGIYFMNDPSSLENE